jgi:uncharacterized protein YndB with AHSA1/START domain
MWFKVDAVDVSFAASASQRFEFDITTTLSPARAFEVITAPAALSRWLPGLKASRWLEGEGGAGALRLVSLPTIAVHERVLVWEPGVRFSFAIEKATLPILKHMVEDMALEPHGAGTRLRWTIAYAPRLLARPLTPILRPRFQTMFAKAADNLGALPH